MPSQTGERWTSGSISSCKVDIHDDWQPGPAESWQQFGCLIHVEYTKQPARRSMEGIRVNFRMKK